MKASLRNLKSKLLKWKGLISYAYSVRNFYNKSTYSFSQSGEDLIVKYLFDTMRKKKPSYMDIGAHHPFYLNNTALLYQLGSTGINIEPDPGLIGEFIKYRKKDINLNFGVSENQGELDFYLINVPTLNTFSKETAVKYKEEGSFFITDTVKIKVDNIYNIIEKYNNGKFPDFLNIDAEGIDEIILHSINYEKSYPIVICVETNSFSMKGLSIKNTEIIRFLESKGYINYADTNINTIFIRKDHWIKS